MLDKKKLIAKFLSKEANASELEKLEVSLEESDVYHLFKKMVKVQYIVALSMKRYNTEQAKESIKRSIKKKAARKRWTIYSRWGVAASVLFLVVFSVSKFANNAGSSVETVIPIQQIKPGTDKAILTLENGNQVVLEEGREYQSKAVNGDGQKLVYKKSRTKEIKYNFLTVPRGGQFYVELSDGTEVWLNSDSKLRYPVSFSKGETRKVELVYGEAFFKVSPSSDHDGASFNVLTKGQEINVLGTQFNVKGYNDDEFVATTLVEGSVTVHRLNGNSKLLKVGQQSKIELDKENIEIVDVDVSQEIAWRNNLFSFEDKSLGEIMKILARWYDAEIVFETNESMGFMFTGILERSSTIEDVLTHIEATGDGEIRFQISNRVIIIN